MRIGIIQSDIILGSPDKNIAKVKVLINKLFTFGSPDVVILPELWYTGYDYTTLYENAIEDNDVLELVGNWVKDFSALWIPGSFPIKGKKGIYNRAYAISHDGKLLATYNKLHLFGPMSEKRYFTQGDSITTFVYKGVTFGLSICYDLRFPELFRLLTLNGARVIFLPTEWPTPRMTHFNILMRARAIENQVYMVSANRVGKDSMSEFSGGSLVVDPWGEDVCRLGDGEDVALCDIDLSLLDRVRTRIPVFSDRREDVYKIEEIE